MAYHNKIGLHAGASVKVQTGVLSSQAIGAINVLRMSTDEAKQLVDKTLDENLFLTRSTDAATKTLPYDGQTPEIAADPPSFVEHILSQLGSCGFDTAEKNLAFVLFENLDERGLLPEGICKDLSEKSKKVLRTLQQLEPAGIFGCGVAGSIRLQLERTGPVSDDMNAVLKNLGDLVTGGIERVAFRAGLNQGCVEDCLTVIKTLNPWPAYGWHKVYPQDYIAPEVAITVDEAGVSAKSLINLGEAITFDAAFDEDIRRSSDAQCKRRFDALRDQARNLMSAIEMRHDTIMKITLCIGANNERFFSSDDDNVVRISMREIGDQVGLHESTVSRAVRGVYAKTPRGVFELRSFFSSKSQALDVHATDTATNVQTRILELIRDEIVPLSDSEIRSELEVLGTKISRRTVAKYRSVLGIPPMGERLAGQTGAQP